MSTANKLIVALLVLIILVLGWLYLNKTTDSADIQSVESVTNSGMTAEEAYELEGQHNHGHHDEAAPHISHEGHDHGTADQVGVVGETGTVKILPVDPVLGVRGVGDPNAPIKIQEFFSLTCNHCADFHIGPYQEIKKKYIDTGKVYFVYHEFPLNGPALYGSMIARCLPEARYAGFVDMLLRNQEAWAFGGDFRSALMQNAKLAGMSEEEFDTCFSNEDLQKAIANNISAASEAWKITSTPSFIVNDGERIIRGGKSIEHFDTLINELSNKEVPAETPTEAPTEAE